MFDFVLSRNEFILLDVDNYSIFYLKLKDSIIIIDFDWLRENSFFFY